MSCFGNIAKRNLDNLFMELKKKSVCIVVQLFYPESPAMAVRNRYLADAFLDAGYDTSILTSNLSKGIKEYQVQTLWSPIGSNQDSAYIRLFKELVYSLEMFFRVLFHPAQLFFISSPPFTISYAASLACRITGKRFIFDVRDEYPEVYFIEGLVNPDGLFGKLLRRIERNIYRKSELTTTVTERIVEKLGDKSGQPDKIRLVRNGFADNISVVDQLSTDPFNIVFHGNMGKFQNPQLIVEVAKKCEAIKLPVNFLVYGWGAQTQVILDAQEDISILQHLGTIGHEEVPQLLKTISLGISFQGNTDISKNSFPSKVMEFIGSGIPSLVTPISEAGRFVEKHGVGYQFDANDSDGIVEKISELVNNPQQLLEMSSRSKSIRDSLSRKKISDDFVSSL